MSVSPRLAAAEIVSAVLDEGRTLEAALAQTHSFKALEGRDRAFARAIASATLRRLGGIDAVLARFVQRPLPDGAKLARALLRTAAAQLLVLKTPPHAVVSETVTLANSARATAAFAKLMNAVLRKVASEGGAILEALPPGADLPGWLYARWRAAYGDGVAAEIAAALLEEPPLDLSVKSDAEGWAQRLGGVVLPTGAVRLAGDSRKAEDHPTPYPLPSRGGVETLPGFSEGEWWVQDAAAALPARLLGEVRGQDVLDLCAAPGGKTMQLAAAGARVTALDISAERLERVRANLSRTRLQAEIVCADALEWRSEPRFDAILLDAPCSATGTLRRHPDVAWVRRPTDLKALTDLQGRLLARAGAWLKPGGRLVYAVCSLEPEEGPEIVAAALKAGGWRRSEIGMDEVGEPLVSAEGDLRTLPSHLPDRGGMDGFYAARLVGAA
ncbi:MAG: methyltransferase domain-containing protein [Hyphomonadaceae bacterium]|nr:methyltransferase domain-containing protein [Hyphomonadaceae bacterium]